MENKLITIFESNITLIDYCEKNNIDIKKAKKIMEEYIELFCDSKINVKFYGLDFLKQILKDFETGMTIREISFEYDMLDEDIAKIIHVMLFNKNRNNFKYNFIVIPAKNDNEFVLKCKQLGIKLDKYIKIEEKNKIKNLKYINNSKNFKRKENDISDNEKIIEMYDSFYTIYKIAEILNRKVRYVVKVLNNHFIDSDETVINRIMPIEYASNLIKNGMTLEEIQIEYGVPIEYLKILLNIEKELEFNYKDFDKNNIEKNIIDLYLTGKYKSREIAKMLNVSESVVSITITKTLNNKILSTPKAVAAILLNNASLEHLTKYSDANHVILTDYSIIEGYKLANKITLKK